MPGLRVVRLELDLAGAELLRRVVAAGARLTGCFTINGKGRRQQTDDQAALWDLVAHLDGVVAQLRAESPGENGEGKAAGFISPSVHL